jgi:uncharacterized delta-60 repeat protein
MVFTGINRLNIQDDGQILISGSFTKINGVSRNGLARLNPDGSLDSYFETDLGEGSNVKACQIQNDGKILIGGSRFSNKDGITIKNLIRLTVNGILDSEFDAPEWTNTKVSVLEFDHERRVLVGLEIDIMDGEDEDEFVAFTAARLERLNSEGKHDVGFKSIRISRMGE